MQVTFLLSYSVCPQGGSVVEMIELLHPERIDGVGRHTPVAARTERDGADLWSVRQAGALELLGEETAVEVLQPFGDGGAVIAVAHGIAGEAVNLARGEAPAQDVVEEKVMQGIGTDQILRLLADFSVNRRQQLG